MNNAKSILTKGQVIDDKYTITFFLKKGSYAESYRVIDKEKKQNFKVILLFKID